MQTPLERAFLSLTATPISNAAGDLAGQLKMIEQVDQGIFPVSKDDDQPQDDSGEIDHSELEDDDEKEEESEGHDTDAMQCSKQKDDEEDKEKEIGDLAEAYANLMVRAQEDATHFVIKGLVSLWSLTNLQEIYYGSS